MITVRLFRVLVPALLLVGFGFLSGCEKGRSDRAMIQHWRQHATEFERLKELLQQGGENSFGSKPWHLSAAGLSAMESSELRKIAEGLHLAEGYRGHDAAYLYEQSNTYISKGYAYLEFKPGALEKSLDVIPQHSGNYFLHLEGNWYLYMRVLG